MGQAKQRGTRTQRIEQAIERQAKEDAIRSAQLRQQEAERREREQRRSELRKAASERPVVVVSDHDRHHSRSLIMALAAAALSPGILIVDPLDRPNGKLPQRR